MCSQLQLPFYMFSDVSDHWNFGQQHVTWCKIWEFVWIWFVTFLFPPSSFYLTPSQLSVFKQLDKNSSSKLHSTVSVVLPAQWIQHGIGIILLFPPWMILGADPSFLSHWLFPTYSILTKKIYQPQAKKEKAPVGYVKWIAIDPNQVCQRFFLLICVSCVYLIFTRCSPRMIKVEANHFVHCYWGWDIPYIIYIHISTTILLHISTGVSHSLFWLANFIPMGCWFHTGFHHIFEVLESFVNNHLQVWEWGHPKVY